MPVRYGRGVALTIDPERQVKEFTCEHCGGPSQRVTGFVHRDGDALAVYFASCYHHGGHEVWFDVVFSATWAEGVDDRVTFGCRVGPIEGQDDPASSLVTGGAAFRDSLNFGHKLTREEALAHPLLADFWAVVDHVLSHDQLVRDHIYGPGAILDVD